MLLRIEAHQHIPLLCSCTCFWFFWLSDEFLYHFYDIILSERKKWQLTAVSCHTIFPAYEAKSLVNWIPPCFSGCRPKEGEWTDEHKMHLVSKQKTYLLENGFGTKVKKKQMYLEHMPFLHGIGYKLISYPPLKK